MAQKRRGMGSFPDAANKSCGTRLPPLPAMWKKKLCAANSWPISAKRPSCTANLPFSFSIRSAALSVPPCQISGRARIIMLRIRKTPPGPPYSVWTPWWVLFFFHFCQLQINLFFLVNNLSPVPQKDCIDSLPLQLHILRGLHTVIELVLLRHFGPGKSL